RGAPAVQHLRTAPGAVESLHRCRRDLRVAPAQRPAAAGVRGRPPEPRLHPRQRHRRGVLPGARAARRRRRRAPCRHRHGGVGGHFGASHVKFYTTVGARCGIGDYSAALLPALRAHVAVETVVLRPNRLNPFALALDARRLSAADVAHVQHTYSFFGVDQLTYTLAWRLLRAAIRAPLVITAHTVRPPGPARYDGGLGALAELTRADGPVLLVAGGPRLTEHDEVLAGVRADAARAGLADRLVVTGYLPPADVPVALETMDVVVVPYATEDSVSYSLH